MKTIFNTLVLVLCCLFLCQCESHTFGPEDFNDLLFVRNKSNDDIVAYLTSNYPEHNPPHVLIAFQYDTEPRKALCFKGLRGGKNFFEPT